MPNNLTNWKADNYKFVGKAFDYAYADRLNKLLAVVGETTSKSVDYELSGSGGYGELAEYDGVNLNMASQKRGFRTIITPHEYSKSDTVGMRAAAVDKLGETKKVGTRLGDSAAVSVYLKTLRMFRDAFNPVILGGDGKPWAAADHPNAAMSDEGRRRVPDPDSGTYSNLISDTLSVAAIGKAQTMAAKFTTPDGLPFLCEMDTVLVSPALAMEAKKLFGENSQLRPLKNPEDNSNAANPVHDMTYLVVGGGNDGFSDKQWALCDRRIMKELVKIVYNFKPMVVNSQMDNPLIDLFTAYVAYGLGWGDARQIIFSNPK